MRAVLLASATATTRLGRRWRSPITHGSALVAFERSKLALAPLIRSRRKYWFPRLDIPPRRCLPPVEFCRGTRPSQARTRAHCGSRSVTRQDQAGAIGTDTFMRLFASVNYRESSWLFAGLLGDPRLGVRAPIPKFLCYLAAKSLRAT